MSGIIGRRITHQQLISEDQSLPSAALIQEGPNKEQANLTLSQVYCYQWRWGSRADGHEGGDETLGLPLARLSLTLRA